MWGIHLTGVAELRALLWEGPIFAELNQRPGPMTFSYRSCSAYVNSPDVDNEHNWGLTTSGLRCLAVVAAHNAMFWRLFDSL
jgi:hypothetical protein